MEEVNQQRTTNSFHVIDTKTARVKIFTAFPPEYIKCVYDENYLTIQQVSLPKRQEILLAAIHFTSQLNSDEDKRQYKIGLISKKLRDVEKDKRLSKTVLVGDLNLNPFAKEIISARGLHAVMTRTKAKTMMRTVDQEAYPFFYNPMWGLFGDSSESPPGTYYYDKSRNLEYFWHMLDQVLLRPELLDLFDNNSLKILTKTGKVSLVRRDGRPDASSASDHLPLLFALNL